MVQFPLAERYLAIRPEALRRSEDLEVALATMVLQARAAHPGISVDPATFVDFLATRLPIDLCERHLADLYLACACAVGAFGAAARLEELCLSQVGPAIGRIDRSAGFIAEIRQRTRDKLLAGAIAEYGARGSLAAYVRLSAIREALRHRAGETVRGESELQHALRDALATLDLRELAALRLSYLDRMSLDQIGRLFHVHHTTAARWVSRAQERVRSQVQHRLGLSDLDAERVLLESMSGVLASSVAAAA